jgi:ABC-type tungstate transport system permease subunit
MHKYITFIFILINSYNISYALTKFIDTRTLSTEPKEIYGEAGIRIGNGGAGPTGILRALANDYFNYSNQKTTITWYQDISPNTLIQLKNKKIDIALIYEEHQAKKAVADGWANNYTLIFYDHFIIVGPKSNPAKISSSDGPIGAFKKIKQFHSLEIDKSMNGRFLSRDDNSGTNMAEQRIWQSIAFKPWAKDDIHWYIKFHTFPVPAVIEADKNSMYTMTDYGTWLLTKNQLKNSMLYIHGGTILLNPCYALLNIEHSKQSEDFLNYLKSKRAQDIIAKFNKDAYGSAFFTPANQPDFSANEQISSTNISGIIYA